MWGPKLYCTILPNPNLNISMKCENIDSIQTPTLLSLQCVNNVEEFVQSPSFCRSSINGFDDDEDGRQSVYIYMYIDIQIYQIKAKRVTSHRRDGRERTRIIWTSGRAIDGVCATSGFVGKISTRFRFVALFHPHPTLKPPTFNHKTHHTQHKPLRILCWCTTRTMSSVSSRRPTS